MGSQNNGLGPYVEGHGGAGVGLISLEKSMCLRLCPIVDSLTPSPAERPWERESSERGVRG